MLFMVYDEQKSFTQIPGTIKGFNGRMVQLVLAGPVWPWSLVVPIDQLTGGWMFFSSQELCKSVLHCNRGKST